jgi:hypothetical protein
MSPVIHLVQLEEGAARPLCGRFVESRNWTTVRDVATCPECVRRDRDPAASVTVHEREPGAVDLEREPA